MESIRVIEAPSFEAFFQLANSGFGSSGRHLIWRGQRRAEWEILSGFARTGKQDFGHLMNFARAVSRLTEIDWTSDVNNITDEEKLRLWSLGQHHGLLTPLTDWTLYPFVALFFAFVEPESDGVESCRAVFALDSGEVGGVNLERREKLGIVPFKEALGNPPYSESFKKYLLDEYGANFSGHEELIRESRIDGAVRDRLVRWESKRLEGRNLKISHVRPGVNRRLHQQGGLHVYIPGVDSVETWIRQNRVRETAMLTKVLMPNAIRAAVLAGLNRMNINYLNLFPDVEGAARHSNLTLFEARGRHFGIQDY